MTQIKPGRDASSRPRQSKRSASEDRSVEALDEGKQPPSDGLKVTVAVSGQVGWKIGWKEITALLLLLTGIFWSSPSKVLPVVMEFFGVWKGSNAAEALPRVSEHPQHSRKP